MILATGLVCAFATAAAARTIYECSFEDMAVNRNWLPTTVIIGYEAGSDVAEVNDNIIQSVNEGPMSIAIKRDTDAQLGLNWELDLESTMGRSLVMRYDFTYLKLQGFAKIKGTVHGGSTRGFVAQGDCKVSKG